MPGSMAPFFTIFASILSYAWITSLDTASKDFIILRNSLLVKPIHAVYSYCDSMKFPHKFGCFTSLHWRSSLGLWKDICTDNLLKTSFPPRYYKIVLNCNTIIGKKSHPLLHEIHFR